MRDISHCHKSIEGETIPAPTDECSAHAPLVLANPAGAEQTYAVEAIVTGISETVPSPFLFPACRLSGTALFNHAEVDAISIVGPTATQIGAKIRTPARTTRRTGRGRCSFAAMIRVGIGAVSGAGRADFGQHLADFGGAPPRGRF